MASYNTKQDNNNSSNTNGSPKAEAFLNFTVVTADGREMKIRKGVVLDSTNLLERSLINAAKADVNFQVQLTGTVHLVVDDSATEDLTF